MVRELKVYGVYAENCYFYIDDDTLSGFIIDPGAQAGIILDMIVRNDWKIERILLTHGHFDHMGAAGFLGEKLSVPVYIYPLDASYLTDPGLNLSGNTGRNVILNHYRELYDNEIIRLRANPDICLKVLYTPGHTPGSLTYYSEKDGVAFVGDTLYEHNLGLTIFPGGDVDELKASILDKILTLPDDTILLSGHSSPITVEEEKKILL